MVLAKLAIVLAVCLASSALTTCLHIPIDDQQTSTAECLKCKTFFTGVIKALGKNATATDLLNAMLAECDKITDNDERMACYDFSHWAVHELPAVEQTFEKYEPVGLCSILGICLVECCSGMKQGAPSQVMLAPTSNPTEMTITWVAAYNEPSAARPTVKYFNVGSSSFVNTTNATMRTYTQGGWQGWILSAVITGISPSASYGYQVGDASLQVWSQTWTFTAWNVGKPGTYAMVADIGLENSDSTVAAVQSLATKGQIDFFAAYGDLSYADAYQAIWDEQGRRLQPITAVVPYLVCPGKYVL